MELGGRDNSNPLPSVQRWIPPSALRRDALTPENVQDATFRKVRELLNKLTPEKFDKLSDDLLQLDLNSSKILKGVILLIFEKALHETKYTSMYARLCKRLTEQAPNFEPPDESCTFKKHLLWVCKNEFENRSRATEAFGNLPLSPDDEDRRQLAKQKMLGNIKFIGELGKHEIVTESILHTCIQELLPKNRKVQTNKDVSENLECLCQIMKTCGRILDSEKGQGLMNQYFSRMKTVQTSTPHLPLRIRFMLQDVEDLRRNNWVPRQANNPEKPVPINQIIEEDHDPVNFILPHRNNGMKEYSENDFFSRPLKTRKDLMMSGTGSNPVSTLNNHQSLDKYSPYNNYGLNLGNYRNHQNRNQNQNNQNNYYQNRNNYNNHNHAHNQNNNHSSNNIGKDMPPRFKKMLQQSTNLEELSLRPPAHSMLCKPPNVNKPRSDPILAPPLITIKPSPPAPVKDSFSEAIVIKQAPPDKKQIAKKGPVKEEVVKKVNQMLETYFTDKNVENATNTLKDTKIPDKLIVNVLRAMFTGGYEKTEEEQKLLFQLLGEMKQEKIFTSVQFLDYYRGLVNNMSDKERESKKAYIANLAGESVKHNILNLNEVADVTEKHGDLFLAILQTLHKVLGKAELVKIFNESKINLFNVIPDKADKTKEKLSILLEEKNLIFLFPLLKIQSELWKHIKAENNPGNFYKWLKDYLEPQYSCDAGFVNALVTVIVKYITSECMMTEDGQINTDHPNEKSIHEKEKQLLEKYKPVLVGFLAENVDLQVTCVYAVQVFCHSLHFPKGMLLRWFNNLYNLEIIEEEAFSKWRENISDAYPGKGEALFQVNAWLNWLAEAESEEEEEEEEN
ncbi:hypothetical protein M8J75_001128 [Diaphorina citri]|nr:hypothetical protein M8J75_001128 [Diaphorina citri]KAI5729155.1 hypothetical protein M8J77_026184 [Diaphorina citri]